MKTYILKKDTPKSKEGERLIKESTEYENGGYRFYRTEKGREEFSVDDVENNPEWFGEEANSSILNYVIRKINKVIERGAEHYDLRFEGKSADSFSVHIKKQKYNADTCSSK